VTVGSPGGDVEVPRDAGDPGWQKHPQGPGSDGVAAGICEIPSMEETSRNDGTRGVWVTWVAPGTQR